MRAAASELEFERAAALRDEIQQIRLRVLEQDASVTVARAAERAAADAGAASRGGLTGAADRNRGRRAAEAAAAAGPVMEVTSVEVLPADEEPLGERAGRRGPRRTGCPASATSTTTRQRRLAGPLARPADLGPDGDPERPQAHGPATGSAPLLNARGGPSRPATVGP